MDTLEPSFCLDQDSSGERVLPAGTPAARNVESLRNAARLAG